ADARAYHDLLADAVRAYLGERFGVPVARQTTEQFLASLGQEPPLSPEQAALLAEFFTRCDLARFAPVAPDAEQYREAAEMAGAVVRQTAPEAVREGGRMGGEAGPRRGGRGAQSG